jgi:ABC-type sugar transport system ATPase subunit
MQQVLRVVNRVIVLRLGHKIYDGERANLTGPQLVGLMTGVVNEEMLAQAGAGTALAQKPKESRDAV